MMKRAWILVAACALLVLFWGEISQAENFTLIPIPDTQNYSTSYPHIYKAQTQWMVDSLAVWNIVFAAHEGDIVNNAGSTTEWMRADTAMSILENPVTTGLAEGIPYSMMPGNHDQPTTNYNSYFGVSRFLGRSYYGGHDSTANDNNYCFFSASGMNFIVISLEYNPSSAAIAWADSLLGAHSNRRAIVVSHYILNTNGSWGGQGQTIYDTLKDNPNLFLMLCGHMHGEAMRTEVFNGDTVYVVLADYQDISPGGNGWLRIMEFQPANNRIRVLTYSPYIDEYGTDTVMGDDTQSAEFFLSYNMDEPSPGWVAYNDLDPRVPADSSIDNAPNVTTYDYAVTGGVLKNFATGADLPVTVTGSYNAWDPVPNGNNANAGTDAGDLFGPTGDRVVDLRGISEIDSAHWYNTITFNHLDPAKEYIITLSVNRDKVEYDGARYTRVTIDGAPTYTNASSPGVVVNSEASVSFCSGYNTVNGYVARWTGVTGGADSSFSVTSQWDTTQGSGEQKTKGYAMSAFCLQEGGAAPQYTLTVNVVGGGSVVLDPPGGSYAESTLVELTAVPDFDWAFESWSGDLSGDVNPDTILMTGNMTVTATFTPISTVYAWAQVYPLTQPPPRCYHAMAYIGQDQVLLFGGYQDGAKGQSLDDTWVFDLSESTWTQMSPNPHPSSRNEHDMAYVGGDQVLLFGGYPDNDETWLYDLSANTWTQLYPSTVPPESHGHAMAYLGEDKAIAFLDESWVFDVSENTWTQINALPKPVTREYLGMARVGEGRAVIYGGWWFLDDDAWVYDLSTNSWTQIGASSQPSSRHFPGMAYLEGDEVLCFGGQDFYGIKDDTWIFDLSDSAWIELPLTTSPSARTRHDVAYIGNGQVLMFGGIDTTGSQLNDTWVFTLTEVVSHPPRSIDDLKIVKACGTAGIGSKDMRLIWSSVTSDTSGAPITVDSYVIYRDTIPDFAPGPAQELAIISDTTFLDIDVAGDSSTAHYYYVTARRSGLESAPSDCVGEFDKDLTSLLGGSSTDKEVEQR